MIWIKCQNSLPKDSAWVEVIFVIVDAEPVQLHSVYRRLIGVGKFYCDTGWVVKNGYIPSTYPHSEKQYQKWDRVTHWRSMSQDTFSLLENLKYDEIDV